MPKLLIHRISEFENLARKIKIELNGKLVAKIKNGEKLVIEVPTGKHVIQAKIDWCSSNLLELEVDNHSKIELALTSGDGSAFNRFIFRTKEYLKLTKINR